jgi:hypothetical protein
VTFHQGRRILQFFQIRQQINAMSKEGHLRGRIIFDTGTQDHDVMSTEATFARPTACTHEGLVDPEPRGFLSQL